MKFFPIFLLIIFFSFSVDSTEIATFKISYVIDNSLEFGKFIDKLDVLKTKMQNSSDQINELEGRARTLYSWQLILTASIAFCWSLFQLWYASPLPYFFKMGVFIDEVIAWAENDIGLKLNLPDDWRELISEVSNG